MTEREWLTCTDPEAMLGYLFNVTSQEREQTLYACACCRSIWHLLTDPRSRQAVEVAERFAEGQATAEELSAALSLAWQAHRDIEQAWIDRILQGFRTPGVRCGQFFSELAYFPSKLRYLMT